MSIDAPLQWDHCLLCGNKVLEDIDIPLLAGITSDCKPWPVAMKPSMCPKCGHVQKRRSKEWLSEAEAIYAGYTINQDQKLISIDGSIPRKETVLSVFLENQELPVKGKLLDVGCGNGNFFPFFNKVRPDWDIYGCEYNKEFRESVLSMPGVKGFHDGPLDALPSDYPDFDLVTQFFVIEHLTDPVGVMRQIRNVLNPGGLVLVHTDDLQLNPFDLNVLDHTSHFVLDILVYVMRLAGFEPVFATDQWVPKQISVVAKIGKEISVDDVPFKSVDVMRQLFSGHLQWLHDVYEQAKELAREGHLGIFGTAIAGTWLANALDGGFDFFVDEAPDKVSIDHMGKKVFRIAEAPSGSTIFLAFPTVFAEKILERVSSSRPDVNFVIPTKR